MVGGPRQWNRHWISAVVLTLMCGQNFVVLKEKLLHMRTFSSKSCSQLSQCSTVPFRVNGCASKHELLMLVSQVQGDCSSRTSQIHAAQIGQYWCLHIPLHIQLPFTDECWSEGCFLLSGNLSLLAVFSTITYLCYTPPFFMSTVQSSLLAKFKIPPHSAGKPKKLNTQLYFTCVLLNKKK